MLSKSVVGGFLSLPLVFPEGYGLQPVRKSLKAGTASAAEGASSRSGRHLSRQIDHADGDNVEVSRLGSICHARRSIAEFIGAVDEACAQTVSARRLQVAGVRRAHHHFIGLKAEKIRS